MKYCAHCGMELSDEAEVCLGCGCVPVVKEQRTFNAIRTNNNRIVLIIIAAISAVALAVGGMLLVNYIRQVNVVKDLSGDTFRYYDSISYPSLGEFYYTEKELKFDDDGKLLYSYYFSSIDAGDEYDIDYKIKFKNGMIILETQFEDEFEIQYDKYNNIQGIYDINLEELYE